MIGLGSGKVGIALGDVSRHGIGAALLMTAVRSSLWTNIRHHGADLTALFHQVNRDLVRDTGADKSVTLFYGVLDDENRLFIWPPAGTTRPYGVGQIPVPSRNCPTPAC